MRNCKRSFHELCFRQAFPDHGNAEAISHNCSKSDLENKSNAWSIELEKSKNDLSYLTNHAEWICPDCNNDKVECFVCKEKSFRVKEVTLMNPSHEQSTQRATQARIEASEMDKSRMADGRQDEKGAKMESGQVIKCIVGSCNKFYH
jgi:hypothetical protein